MLEHLFTALAAVRSVSAAAVRIFEVGPLFLDLHGLALRSSLLRLFLQFGVVDGLVGNCGFQMGFCSFQMLDRWLLGIIWHSWGVIWHSWGVTWHSWPVIWHSWPVI